MRNNMYGLSELITKAVLEEGEQDLDLTVRSLKEILITAIQNTPNETLVKLIRSIFPTNPMYMPISELVGEKQHTTIRNLENA
jgi:hypothetical protein